MVQQRAAKLYLLWKTDYPLELLCYYAPEELARKEDRPGIVSEALKTGITACNNTLPQCLIKGKNARPTRGPIAVRFQPSQIEAKTPVPETPIKSASLGAKRGIHSAKSGDS